MIPTISTPVLMQLLPVSTVVVIMRIACTHTICYVRLLVCHTDLLNAVHSAYTLWVQKRPTILFVDNFSKCCPILILYLWIQQEICNNTVVMCPTTHYLCSYTTLQNLKLVLLRFYRPEPKPRFFAKTDRNRYPGFLGPKLHAFGK